MANSVFPECSFFVDFDDGGPLLGSATSGMLRLRTDAAIPRARLLTARFVVVEEAVEDAHEHPERRRRVHFARDLSFPIAGGLAAGEHRFPFVMELPESLPQAYAGAQDEIEYAVDVRLDVDWAVDPERRLTFAPRVPPLAPVQGPPCVARPPPHDDVAVEMTLASAVVAQGEPVDVRVAIRSDREHPLAQLRVALYHRCVAYTFGARAPSREREVGYSIEVPDSRLRTGETITMRLPTDGLPFEQRTSMLAISSFLRLTVRPRGLLATSATWDVDLVVVPRGTVVHRTGERLEIGNDRLRAMLGDLAAAKGLSPGDAGALIRGREGPVSIRIVDGAGRSQHGARVELGFPSLGLGLAAKPASILGGLVRATTPETPAELASRVAIVVDPESPHLDPAAARAFVEAACDGLARSTGLGLSDEALSYRERLPSDEREVWTGVLDRARTKARALRGAIAALPLGAPGVSRTAWEATAVEEDAVLVPSRPALVGLTRSVRILTGESRTVRATLGATWDDDTPLARLDVEVVDAELPTPLTAGSMPALRALLPDVEVTSSTRLVASGAPLPCDPRVLLPALDAVLAWILEARGERTVVAPYR